MEPVLVLGYGSDLRGDDAAGRRAAEAVEARGLDGVQVRSVQQLLPEHAAEVAGRRLVLFVDASTADVEVAVRRLAPEPPRWNLTHHLRPEAVLGLAAAVGTPPEAALLVTVPATDVGLGTGLSHKTRAAVAAAVERVVSLCLEPAATTRR
jgi:hydrogenase maturation protease